MSLLDDLHKTIIAALRSDTALSAMLGSGTRVHERIPPKRSFPCIVVEQSACTDWSTDDLPGRDVIVTVTVWSRGDNRAELHAVSDKAIEVLEADMVAGGDLEIVLTTLISAAYERDAFNRAYRATMRFRFLVEPTDP